MDSTPVIAGMALVAVFETIAHPLPNQVFECDRFCGCDALLPAPIALGNFDRPFGAAEDVVLGIDDLGDEFAGTRARPMVGNGYGEDSMGERRRRTTGSPLH